MRTPIRLAAAVIAVMVMAAQASADHWRLRWVYGEGAVLDEITVEPGQHVQIWLMKALVAGPPMRGFHGAHELGNPDWFQNLAFDPFDPFEPWIEPGIGVIAGMSPSGVGAFGMIHTGLLSWDVPLTAYGDTTMSITFDPWVVPGTGVWVEHWGDPWASNPAHFTIHVVPSPGSAVALTGFAMLFLRRRRA